jgi:two-component system sensor histidine kinase DegS
MAVHNKADGHFSEQDVNILCSFANQAAVAIDNTELTRALMQAQKSVEEKAETLQQLLKQTLDIQENERRRIAADIHDGVVSQIVGALYELEACFQLNFSEDLDERLQLLKQLLNQAIEQTRTSIHNLWPATLDHMGLIPALQELFKRRDRLTDLHHRLVISGTPYQLKPQTQIAIYRIVQEALNNACQHGMANQIDMTIRFGKRKISIDISDNGQGFDVQQILRTPLACHFGLIGMQERAQSIGGNLLVKSEPGHGCKVTLTIPSTEAIREGL